MALLGKLLKKKNEEEELDDGDELLDWASEVEADDGPGEKVQKRKGRLGKFLKRKAANKEDVEQDEDEPEMSISDDEDEEEEEDEADEADRLPSPEVNLRVKTLTATTLKVAASDAEESSEYEESDDSEGSLDDDSSNDESSDDGDEAADALMGIFEEETIVDQTLETLASSVEDVEAEELVEDLRNLMADLRSLGIGPRSLV